MKQTRLAAGDTVMVLSGKYKGKRGKIKLVRRHDGVAEVEGVNVVKRHSKATATAKAGILEKELPMPVGRLMYVCPKCNKPGKLARIVKGEGKERICRRCHEPADRPVKA
ncbi:MAG TPA: 50S ribosomal protein L24 [Candidatus Eremiobacteraceae bacterium]|nr:50S ribosomal protein L24 [Candidatus Eremiobacteraceae bacterium]